MYFLKWIYKKFDFGYKVFEFNSDIERVELKMQPLSIEGCIF